MTCLQRYKSANNLYSDAQKLIIKALEATRRQQGAFLKRFPNTSVLVMSIQMRTRADFTESLCPLTKHNLTN